MPDYSNNTGRTYTSASGSVRFNNSVITVRKIKPAETSRDSQHAYAFGQANPQGIIKGRRVIGTTTVSVPLKEWSLFITANPNWEDIEVSVAVSYLESVLGAFTFNHDRCQITKDTPSESDAGTTSEPLMDLELLPLAVKHAGKTGTAQP